MVADPKTFYTKQEYVALENAAEHKHEYINGQIVPLHGDHERRAESGAIRAHATLKVNVTGILYNQLRSIRPRQLFSNEMGVLSSEKGSHAYPDLVIACEPIQFTADEHALVNPIAIIEVLSPDTEAYDRGDKFHDYLRIVSLHDYVLIAQDAMSLEHFERRSDESWLLRTARTPDATVILESIGCQLKAAEIYERVAFPVMKYVPRPAVANP